MAGGEVHVVREVAVGGVAVVRRVAVGVVAVVMGRPSQA